MIYLKKKNSIVCMDYLSAAQCVPFNVFLCHISNYFPEWYCVYGMSVCLIFYAAAKSFLYGFFLERAKMAQTTTRLLPEFATKYILPIYIAGYFTIYAILCPLSFRGLLLNPVQNNLVPTACLFDEYKPWIFLFSANVDVFNSIFFLFVFIYPLYHDIKKK
eukprot:1128451_1